MKSAIKVYRIIQEKSFWGGDDGFCRWIAPLGPFSIHFRMQVNLTYSSTYLSTSLREHPFVWITEYICQIVNHKPARVSFLENSRDFFWNFTSRSRSRGISISLSLLEKSETKNHFTFHFSKRVKGIFVSLFISRKKWKHFRFHSFSREKRVKLGINLTCVHDKIEEKKCNHFWMVWEQLLLM